MWVWVSCVCVKVDKRRRWFGLVCWCVLCQKPQRSMQCAWLAWNARERCRMPPATLHAKQAGKAAAVLAACTALAHAAMGSFPRSCMGHSVWGAAAGAGPASAAGHGGEGRAPGVEPSAGGRQAGSEQSRQPDIGRGLAAAMTQPPSHNTLPSDLQHISFCYSRCDDCRAPLPRAFCFFFFTLSPSPSPSSALPPAPPLALPPSTLLAPVTTLRPTNGPHLFPSTLTLTLPPALAHPLIPPLSPSPPHTPCSPHLSPLPGHLQEGQRAAGPDCKDGGGDHSAHIHRLQPGGDG